MRLIRVGGLASDSGIPVQIFLIDTVTIVGRAKSQGAISIECPRVRRILSRSHAKLFVINKGGESFVQLVDCKTTNGTFVNAIRVDQHRLRDGEEVVFGGGPEIPLGSKLCSLEENYPYRFIFCDCTNELPHPIPQFIVEQLDCTGSDAIHLDVVPLLRATHPTMHTLSYASNGPSETQPPSEVTEGSPTIAISPPKKRKFELESTTASTTSSVTAASNIIPAPDTIHSPSSSTHSLNPENRSLAALSSCIPTAPHGSGTHTTTEILPPCGDQNEHLPCISVSSTNCSRTCTAEDQGSHHTLHTHHIHSTDRCRPRHESGDEGGGERSREGVLDANCPGQSINADVVLCEEEIFNLPGEPDSAAPQASCDPVEPAHEYDSEPEQKGEAGHDSGSGPHSGSGNTADPDCSRVALAEFTCTVCHEPVVGAVILRCTHLFCEGCVYQWLAKDTSKRKECPLCRAAITHRPLRAPAIDAAVLRLVSALSEDERNDWHERRARYVDVKSTRDRQLQMISRAIRQSRNDKEKHFLDIRRLWDQDEKTIFQKGLAYYSDEARIAYCSTVGLTEDFVNSADEKQLRIAASNVSIAFSQTLPASKLSSILLDLCWGTSTMRQA
eukprot:TRINITY_DN7775_c0_g1::TRINITY_DN7775_c0_g1_i1::g.8279::m.8279 TRINITY_DN7775_c0_g1::TRINITY_DN7775_c0_g1_i1::g.8279  ORF type:complete len:614 (-),score=25.40,sp/Q803C1/RNF8_DANRE/32.26/2e-07,zf-C3HC4_3/PF13920.1/6e-09,FHA/PF00498.21/5.1e-09,zf-RING_2/PF13639.1/2.3e+03,zf-RING_2/PF13639.1/2.2e-08,zf-C3HC4_2/PF13923.1/3.2e+03,zf-C3HC4_2/PF13923.1/3.6e-08,zf-RING_5/PF14634.1/3.3e-07,zf-C3HC4/PF00097.20/3.9e-07,zf-Apc11/PF12861.2/1.1e+04,zf-Apc11/PF12861.2/8.4e-06,zf-RING_UBOX/PF13445.1/0.0016,zf-r